MTEITAKEKFFRAGCCSDYKDKDIRNQQRQEGDYWSQYGCWEIKGMCLFTSSQHQGYGDKVLRHCDMCC